MTHPANRRDHHDPQVRSRRCCHRRARHRFAHRLDDPGRGLGQGWRGGFRVYSGIGLYDSCLRTRWVVNRFGNLVPRTVNVCY
jgi:hypothetical protein